MRAGAVVVAAVLASAGCAPPRMLAFEKHTVDAQYRAEAVAVFDVDRDGHADIVTDMYWYAGPSMVPHEVRAPELIDPSMHYGEGFGIYPQDVDGDGWIDMIVAPYPTQEMGWYRNPGVTDAHWERFVITPTSIAGLETPIVVDLFGTGRGVLLMTDDSVGVLGWYEPPADPTQPWVLNGISDGGFPGAGPYVHGIGMGDVDGDGKQDVLTGYAWFQQTADRSLWIRHDFPFGPNLCSELHVFDVDRDGLADVLCSTPHDYGFYWWHQEPNGGGEPTFTRETIDDTISQMHALGMADLDGDGVPELVTGKRFWAHGPLGDPGVGDPAVLAVFQLRRGAGPVTFDRLDVDQDSGIGTAFAIADVDGDGWKDIAISNKKGVYWFRSH